MTTFQPADELDAQEIAIDQEDLIIQDAISILETRMFKRGPALECPAAVQSYLRLKLSGEHREVVACVFLDSSHCVIAYEPLFYGTIDSTSVHPRVVLQRALEHNSAALIMAHNHPSGRVTPSTADRALTTLLRDLLAKVDIRLLDHFIVGEGEPYSFASAGLI